MDATHKPLTLAVVQMDCTRARSNPILSGLPISRDSHPKWGPGSRFSRNAPVGRRNPVCYEASL